MDQLRYRERIEFIGYLQHFYNSAIISLHAKHTLKAGVVTVMFKGARIALMSMALIFVAGLTSQLGAWRWDEEETEAMDEADLQLAAYRKQVESGISIQQRIQLLDRLIKIFQVHQRNTNALEEERSQLVADDNAIQTVSAMSRQKAQGLFQRAFELVHTGDYKNAQTQLIEAERLNPADKIIADLRQRLDAVVLIAPRLSLDPKAGDLALRGVYEYLQNEPSKALNYLLYAQQKNPEDKTFPALVEMVKQAFPNEGAEILDARLNLVDQKLQRALEKIYAGEYLVAAKECQEVLDLEPENTLALTRLGSVYYAMGQVKQARAYWKQALDLDPKNGTIKSFMDQSASEADRAPSQVLTYKTQKGDTLQSIAEKIYKDRSQWRRLYDANRTYLQNATTLNEGQELVIPPLKGSP